MVWLLNPRTPSRPRSGPRAVKVHRLGGRCGADGTIDDFAELSLGVIQHSRGRVWLWGNSQTLAGIGGLERRGSPRQISVRKRRIMRRRRARAAPTGIKRVTNSARS